MRDEPAKPVTDRRSVSNGISATSPTFNHTPLLADSFLNLELCEQVGLLLSSNGQRQQNSRYCADV